MQISLHGKCADCEKENTTVVLVQDRSNFGDWVGICEDCMKKAQILFTKQAIPCSCTEFESHGINPECYRHGARHYQLRQHLGAE